MTTKEIISEIKADHMTSLYGAFSNLIQVHEENTNPRRDYLGRLTVWKNQEDGKYISHEAYGNEMGWELWEVFEVEPQEVTITKYVPVPNNPTT